MMKFLSRTNLVLAIIIVTSFILFLPGFFTYFHQDDFIHLSYSQKFSQVISAFNIFQKGDFPFYRPIPTQTYFYLGKKLFGLNPVGFHVVNFLIFIINILFVYRLVKLISTKREIALISTIFFAINSTHFAPLYSPAYVHELFYVLFGVLVVDNFLRKKYLLSILFFILALMSKETAVVLPAIILLSCLFVNKKRKATGIVKTLFPYLTILGIYLFAHFIYYGIAKGFSYTLIIGKPTLNILAWYFLWALSTPNILIDFIGPGLKINSVFFQVSQFHGFIYFVLFPILLGLGSILLIKIIRDNNRRVKELIILGISWFIVGMIPLIIFPLHKLATEQAFSLIGLSLSLATLCHAEFISASHGILKRVQDDSKHMISWAAIGFVFVYIIIAVNSIFLARKTHWIVRSAQQAENVIEFVKIHYPKLKDNDTIYFRNGEIKIAPYGSSKQIYQATGNGFGLKLVLNKPNLNLYFEEINPLSTSLSNNVNTIEIDSSKFLGY